MSISIGASPPSNPKSLFFSPHPTLSGAGGGGGGGGGAGGI